MKTELKPCPFCGGKAEFNIISTRSTNNTRGFGFKIKCSKCNITNQRVYELLIDLNSKGLIGFPTDERQAAVDDWNRRF